MHQCPHDQLVAFIITFLKNAKHVKNPYLKAKLVEVLFFFTYPIARGVPGELEAILNSHPLALEHLVSSLMSFYVGKCKMFLARIIYLIFWHFF